MAIDLTPSLLKEVQFKLQDIFNSNQTKKEFDNSPVTAQLILDNQNVLFTDSFKAGGEGNTCVDREVLFLGLENSVIPVAEAPDATIDCEIPAGTGVNSFKKVYKPTESFGETLSISDDLCNNAYTFVELTARGIAGTMAKMADALNRHIIAYLQANSQAILAGNEFTGVINGTTIEYPTTRFDLTEDKTMQIISEWDNLAQVATLAQRYLIADGRNLGIARTQAPFNALNDDGKAAMSRLMFDHVTAQDKRVLESVTGNKSTFLIDPNMLAFYALRTNPIAMTPKGDKDNTMQFAMPLQYKDYNGNVRTMTYNTGMGLETVYVNVDYQMDCDPASNRVKGRNSIHNYDMYITTMFDSAPIDVANGGVSGIINAVAV